MVDVTCVVVAPCLTDEELVAFAIGRLDSTRLAAAHVHLDDCELCQRLLSEAAHSLATAATLPRFQREGVAWNTTFRAGDVVGQRYLIRRFIARGGMGEVYEAFDRELQERVALKTVTSTACDNPSAVRRLKGEVQLARRVSHPNVCRIYDFGTHSMTGSGAQISFLTMEFVDGETLGAHLRSGGALPIADARRLGRQLLLGLTAAHDAGILHRDFKSDNVMLKEVGGQAFPLILDFGLARALDHDGRPGGSVSNAALVGTISYLAPEQLEGKPHSTASDIYSLGMVWFEMLTGELPFEGSPSFAVAALDRMQKPAPLPSSRNSAVPGDLDEIVAGCLRRSPKHRFRTTAQVLARLNDLEQRSRPRWWREKRWFIGASAVSVSMMGVGAMHRQPSEAAGHESPARLSHSVRATPNSLLPATELLQDTRSIPGVPLSAATPAEPLHIVNSPNLLHASGLIPKPRPASRQIIDGGVSEAPPTPSPRRPRSTAPRIIDWENPFEEGAPSKPQ